MDIQESRPRTQVRTERLRLYPCTKAQMEEMIRETSDAELKAAFQQMLDGALRDPEHWNWYAIWMIEGKDGTHIGDLSFKGLQDDGMAEIGYGILENHRHRGYASEAVSAMVQWASEQPGVMCIEAETDPDNAASQRVLLRCGFVPTGANGEEGPRFRWSGSPRGTTAYQDVNAAVIDRWVKEGWEWGRPIDHSTWENARAGVWEVKLTPTKPVPRAWFGELRGKKVLGLASGGGQQMPIFAACGAICTVLDYSDEQLKSERLVARREGYAIDIVKADMTQPFPFEDESFDLIFHPVSNCYAEKVEPIWRECRRVLKPGGILLSGLDNGINYLFDGEDEREVVNSLPFHPLKNPEHMRQLQRDDCGIQFSHTLEEQIGGQLRAGFRLTDLYEDTNGEGRLHELHIPCYIATRSVKEEMLTEEKIMSTYS